ncbi:MAG: bifunctional hydroxymethylpyrimidine kinase/phosphomethylpyrimidine kinase [Coxiellaceae bacterium]|nr:bifunctional hydroxymethylpyrimidine kinase/phosphomethylpyrimidine kinase [Coxiellaceae bacterium]
MKYPTVLTIAGSDSCGGAGIQADIKSISANGGYAASVITTITAQNTQGVQAVAPLDSNLVAEQLNSVCNDIAFDAIKIGVLGSEKNLDVIVQAIQRYALHNIIVDPVMISQSGYSLSHPNLINKIQKKLFPLATLITPNIPEAEILLSTIPDLQGVTPDLIRGSEKTIAAKKLSDKYACNVLLKGGHEKNKQCEDILYIQRENAIQRFTSQRIKTNNTHGTGCSLSSAIATFIARGFSLIDSVKFAHEYIFHAIKLGATRQIGRGNGPICHFYNQRKVLDDIIMLKD